MVTSMKMSLGDTMRLLLCNLGVQDLETISICKDKTIYINPHETLHKGQTHANNTYVIDYREPLKIFKSPSTENVVLKYK